MIFDVLTLFPDIILSVMNKSIIGRAVERGLIQINGINIRDFATDKHKKADDYPYGGGRGMVMLAEPIYRAYLSVIRDPEKKPHVIYMSPQGRPLTQETIIRLKDMEHLVILCGHYEGVDERVLTKIVDEEITIGDYVLTGGELPAMVLMDAVARNIEGVLSSEESIEEDSHYTGLLEYPQYTRPNEFMGMEVPEVLLSGHHAKIKRWRRQQSLLRTLKKRPDLFEKLSLNGEDWELIRRGLETFKL